MPAFALASGAHEVTSSPLNRIAPLVTWYAGSPRQRVRQSGLARAVRAHESVDLTWPDLQFDASQDLDVPGSHVQV